MRLIRLAHRLTQHMRRDVAKGAQLTGTKSLSTSAPSSPSATVSSPSPSPSPSVSVEAQNTTRVERDGLLERHFCGPSVRHRPSASPSQKQLLFAPIDTQTFYCKDSRGQEPNFGAPGGDFGEFLLALDTFLRRSRRELTIDAIFNRWVEQKCTATRPFYLHSDRAALDRLFAAMGRPELNGLEQVTDGNDQKVLLALLRQNVTFHGCGHVRLIAEHPARYEIDMDVMGELMGAFLRRWWREQTTSRVDERRLLFKVYECAMEARAMGIVYGPDQLDVSLLGQQRVVLNEARMDRVGVDGVRAEGARAEEAPGTTVPVTSTSTANLPATEQIFILSHHAVRNFRRRHLAPFFASLDASLDEGRFFAEIETKGWRNAGFTADELARNVPVYRIELNPGAV